MTNNKTKMTPPKILKKLKSLQSEIHNISNRVDEIIDFNELPTRMADIDKFLKENPDQKISTSLLQRRYKIKFTQAISTMNKLRKNKLIK